MRFSLLLCLLLAVPAFSAAQDTNFAVGPQYLITSGPSMFLHPIATPSLSLGEALPPAPDVNPTEAPTSQASAAPAANPVDTFLGSVYWGEHKTGEIIGRRLSTPIMTPSETAWYREAVAASAAGLPSALSAPAPEMPATSTVIELTSAQFPPNIPTTLFDPGVSGIADPASLRERGYGSSLGEIARAWKTQKGRASRVYTNDDLSR